MKAILSRLLKATISAIKKTVVDILGGSTDKSKKPHS